MMMVAVMGLLMTEMIRRGSSVRDIGSVSTNYCGRLVNCSIARLVHQKAHQQKSEPGGNLLTAVTKLTWKNQGMSPLDVYSGVQTFKIGTTALVIDTATVG